MRSFIKNATQTVLHEQRFASLRRSCNAMQLAVLNNAGGDRSTPACCNPIIAANSMPHSHQLESFQHLAQLVPLVSFMVCCLLRTLAFIELQTLAQRTDNTPGSPCISGLCFHFVSARHLNKLSSLNMHSSVVLSRQCCLSSSYLLCVTSVLIR